MIRDEFLRIASRALASHRGTDSVRIIAIRPGARGPIVEWEAPLLSSKRERRALGVLGPPPGPLLLSLLAGTLAARWRDGSPRCHMNWGEHLADRYKRLFGVHSPNTGPGWSWLFEAGAQAIRARGTPKGLKTVEIKEKYGTLRWSVEAAQDCSDIEEILDAVEHLSAFICEDCGAPGNINQAGWLRCQCRRCVERRGT